MENHWCFPLSPPFSLKKVTHSPVNTSPLWTNKSFTAGNWWKWIQLFTFKEMTRLSVPCHAQKWHRPVTCVHLVFAVRTTSLTDRTSSQVLFFAPVLRFSLLGLSFFFFSPSSPSSSLGWLSSSSCLPSAPPLIPHSLFRLCYPSCAFLFVSQGAHPCPVYLDEASPPGQKFCPHRPLAAPLLVFARFQISGTNHQAAWFLNTHCLQILPSPQSR